MPIQILMPALSPTMTEGNLVKWHKSEGEMVSAGEVIAEIETDKATMEVEAVDEGKLGKILIPEGTESVQVNQLIAVLLEDGEDASVAEELASAAPAPAAPSEAASPAAPAMDAAAQISTSSQTPTPPPPPVQSTSAPQQTPSSGGRVFASPLAKRLAGEKGIDLNQVSGSGPNGRIVKKDIEDFQPSAAQALPAMGGFRTDGDPAFTEIKLNNMRKVIAQRLTEAKQQVPHFYLNVDCRIDELLHLRAEINKKREDQKISVNDFIVRACALSLMDVPEANTAWFGDVIRQYQSADVCVAVAVDGGLVTPIVRDAHLKSLSQLSGEVKSLAVRARDGKLRPEEFQGGTFTLSNLGMFGIDTFSAILNPPQACILAVGKGAKRPVVGEDDELEIATVMSCTLSVDHRAVDGAVGARFLAAFKDYIENPLSLLV